MISTIDAIFIATTRHSVMGKPFVKKSGAILPHFRRGSMDYLALSRLRGVPISPFSPADANIPGGPTAPYGGLPTALRGPALK
jgi:hypothetical protein